MKNKNIVQIIYGTVAIAVLALAAFMIKKQRNNESGRWNTYKNDELNIEFQHPKEVEVEVEK